MFSSSLLRSEASYGLVAFLCVNWLFLYHYSCSPTNLSQKASRQIHSKFWYWSLTVWNHVRDCLHTYWSIAFLIYKLPVVAAWIFKGSSVWLLHIAESSLICKASIINTRHLLYEVLLYLHILCVFRVYSYKPIRLVRYRPIIIIKTACHKLSIDYRYSNWMFVQCLTRWKVDIYRSIICTRASPLLYVVSIFITFRNRSLSADIVLGEYSEY